MKYTNGKKADASAFPFKESPAKFYTTVAEAQADYRENPHKAPLSGSSGGGQIHTHPQGAIINEGQTSSNSLDTV